MSQLTATATSTTRPPALQDRHDADRVDHDRTPGRSRLWALIEALAYAGAIVDPSGIMAVERLRRAKEEAERRDQV
jgi:hypothetical protein